MIEYLVSVVIVLTVSYLATCLCCAVVNTKWYRETFEN